MKRRYLVVISVAVVALLGLAGCVPGGGGMMGAQGGQGGGMMGGQGSQGGGMMGGQGSMMGSMMGTGMMSGMPMMGGMTGYYSGVPTALSHDNAKAIAERYLASTNNPDLEINEFEEYSHNFYISIMEKSTGRGAIEIIIDRYSGSYQPEPQSMMWNGKYGMMGSYQTGEMTVTPPQAVKIAQDFLDMVYPGTEAGEIVSYYGYYTIMTTLEGEHYGMLSLSGYSGEIWYHTWHGLFISEVE
ncbi:MAG: peptidase M4 [Chloroflexi bacterium]|nr:peptidase M4 [Chloroflexota bacterium]